MHATVSGLAEYLADDDHHALAVARSIVDRLGWPAGYTAPPRPAGAPPRYDPDEIAGVVPVDYRTPYDVREVIARTVDDSDFLDFKPGYGISTVCVQARVMGWPCAMVGNNGPIDPDGATKTAQFLQLMHHSQTPVVFLQNTTGYMVGVQYERGGMIKHGAKMIQAVTNIEVPKLTFMIGASYGAGNYGMCGRAFEPDFVYSWPTASTGVMGGQQAADVMTLVAEGRAKAKGIEPNREVLAQQSAYLADMFDRQSGGFYTSGRLLDDGMIDPRDTRHTLGFLLATVDEGRRRIVQPNTFGVARM